MSRSSDGYAPIEEYALIGDGRTTALVAADGSIDWLCLPNLDSPSVFGALLDAERGGSFTLRPTIPFATTRRYLPNTNVLETTFKTDRGSVRVTDALLLPDGALARRRELLRSIEGLSGTVPMEWRFTPQFRYGSSTPRREWRGRCPAATYDAEAVAVAHWDAGSPAWQDGAAGATFDLRDGSRAALTLASAYAEPLVLPGRNACAKRLASTIAFWEKWTADRDYQGPWPELVLRSALALKLLIFAPSGASVAAPTTSLPEEIGGERNWDYRFCWIRDSSFAIEALLNLGCYTEAQSMFWWFIHATALTEPEVHVLYKLDGGLGLRERSLPLSGYRHSRPVRVGNGALAQQQHDIYGALFDTAWLYSEGHRSLDWDTGALLARIADHVCRIWRRPDSGIWEVRNGPFHFIHSKVMCWLALNRADRLAARGELPWHRRDRWRKEADAIREYVETVGWSDRLQSYRRIAGEDDVDASLLMLATDGFVDPRGARMNGTIDAITRALREGDFIYRYRAADGVGGGEGCFLNCSFWLVSALAMAGRLDEATSLMENLLARANDVGLYSEEIDPANGAFLGNFPQALVHLALVQAACACGAAQRS